MKAATIVGRTVVDTHVGADRNLTALLAITPPQWSANGRAARFGRTLGTLITNSKHGLHAEVLVERCVDEAHTDVIVSLGGGCGVATIKLSMTAGELRELAAALVSAAHDLEARR